MNIRELAKRGLLPRIQQLQDEINANEAEITRLANGQKPQLVHRVVAQKKIAWQSTPEGRATLSRAQRKRYRDARANAAKGDK